ncbi:MAG: AI-2E family transporter [Bacteroidales bacterium]|nr:AI-2E family transporter [Bacteroidales bacterium]
MAKEEKHIFSPLVKWIIGIAAVILILFLLWYFRFLMTCIFLAIIFSLVGRPLMGFFEKVKIGKYHISKSLCAVLTLFIEVGILFLVIYLLVPLVISQAMNFSGIDMEKISDYYSVHIKQAETFVSKYNLLPDDISLERYLSGKIVAVFNSFKLPTLAASILSFGTNLIMGIFVTVFITFFFLKDSHMVMRFVDNITPDKYIDEIHNIIINTRKLISRYFLGVFCEILLMISLLGIGFYIVGFANAFLVAAICGIMVILPYIGVLIGGGIGLLITITSFLAQNPNGDIFPLIFQFVIIFIIVKLIDDFLLQPVIYSKSVKAQPLEIFLVILIAGKVGGIIGMILAIPVYTFLRIIAKEFFSKWKFIKALTKEIGND